MGNSTVKSHQATEVRLKSREGEQAAQADSQQSQRGWLGNPRVVEKPWFKTDRSRCRLLPPNTLMSFGQ